MEQEKYRYKVRVSCITYNHAAFIEDAMNGFCMQETSFPFVCTIVDDASSDGEQEVIKKYMEEHFNLDDTSVFRKEETADYFLTYAQHKTNKNCYFAALFLKYNHRSVKKPKNKYLKEWNDTSKFIALCEGDDYWIDPQKLQLQVSFLENHQDFSMSFHECSTTSGREFYSYPLSDTLTAKDIILRHMIPTASLVFNRHFAKKIKNFNLSFGDIPIEIQLALQGKVHFLPRKMSCYRDNNSNSITHNKEQMKKGVKDSVLLYYYLLKYYPLNKYSIFLFYRLCRSILLFPKNYFRVNYLIK